MPRELVLDLARALREHVAPLLGAHSGRAALPPGTGGDVTFAIDRDAEDFLERYLAERAPDVAYYSEDQGLVLGKNSGISLAGNSGSSGGTADGVVLLVDPIDGTRPALAGLESCCVSVAAAKLGDGRPTMGDVEVACVAEIKTGATFLAERGKGIELTDGEGRTGVPALRSDGDVSSLFWTTGFRGRPALPLVEVLEELIDLSSVGGGFFDLGSASFDLTRIITGQLDAYVDVGPRMIDTVPSLRKRFEDVGGGAVLNNSPYDLAAAVLCVREAGGAVSDAYGKPLDRRLLLGSGHEYQMSCVAASHPKLHAEVFEVVERGIRRLSARHG